MALNVLSWAERLRPYRRRVRLLLAWRYGAMGGIAGALVATLLSLLDWRALLVVYPWQLAATVGIGMAIGVLYAMALRLSDPAVAQLIDRRAGLKDRLQTALEHSEGTHLFDAPLLEDAHLALQSVSPSQVLRLRFGRWQQLFAGSLALLLFVHFLPPILAIAIPERREEQKEIKQVAEQVQEVAKPILEEAKKPDADELTKHIARQVELYNKRAREAKMSKQEALLRYNQLMEQARLLEQQNQRALEQLSRQAQTAGARLEQLAREREQLQLPPEASQRLQQLNQAEQRLRSELERLQQQLQSGKDAQGNPLTEAQRAALREQIQQLQATLNALHGATLSHQIRALQQQLQSGKGTNGRPLTPEQRAALQEQLRRLQALQNSAAADLQRQMELLQRQIQTLQQQLHSGKDANGNPLSQEQLEQLQRQLQSLQEQLRALKLSQEAQEFLRKFQEALRNDPAFKEAMEHLRKLAEQMQQMRQQQDPQQRKLTQEEIEQRLQQLEQLLEQLAQQYKTDAQIRELARQLLEQVKQMKELSQCQGACMGLGLSGGFGLGSGMSLGSAALRGLGQGAGGAWDKSDYFGQPETFNQGEKQPELKIPLKDTPVSAPPPLGTLTGEYMDYKAPPTPGSSSVPLTQALPSYQKKAEQALSQQNIPPAERKRVKRYFDSLQRGK